MQLPHMLYRHLPYKKRFCCAFSCTKCCRYVKCFLWAFCCAVKSHFAVALNLHAYPLPISMQSQAKKHRFKFDACFLYKCTNSVNTNMTRIWDQSLFSTPTSGHVPPLFWPIPLGLNAGQERRLLLCKPSSHGAAPMVVVEAFPGGWCQSQGYDHFLLM